MTVAGYGDFSRPCSYLASQRADLPGRAGPGSRWAGVAVGRRAVERTVSLISTTDSDIK